MTALRLISLPTHGALEMSAGLLTMAAPFLLGFGPAGAVVSVVVGVLMVGLALGAVDSSAPMPVSAHHDFDQGLALGVLGSAGVVGFAGDSGAALFLAAVAVAQLALALTTRYTRR